jgi:uncharacterized protein YjbI with pentapeptide repeats
MSEMGLASSFDRRVVIALFAAVVPSVTVFGGTRERPSVREVVTALKQAERGRRPDLSHLDLSNLNLADVDFKGADLSASNLFGADLTGSDLEGANLSRAVLDRSILVRARFTNATLQHASIRRPSVSLDLSFDPPDLPTFRNANLVGVQLTARLDGADFSGADLSNASFTLWHERDLGGAPSAGLDRCDFTAAKMQGINMRGLSLTQSSFRDADLRGADLRDTDLRGANLTGALLDGAKLDDAKLDGVVGLSPSR